MIDSPAVDLWTTLLNNRNKLFEPAEENLSRIVMHDVILLKSHDSEQFTFVTSSHQKAYEQNKICSITSHETKIHN
jgi:hypothetical protein